MVDGAEHTITLNGVAEHNTQYDLPDLAAALQVGNWFSQQEEAEDYGEEGYHADMPMGELLRNPRCFEIVKGWIMAKQTLDISTRFKFVSSLSQYRDSGNYNKKPLVGMKTPRENYTAEDFALLNKLLRSVKRT